ncbi:SI1L3 protein, partial [Melanocharis versteri]|nr:SI1L3 protein [Melanocharis versteri]
MGVRARVAEWPPRSKDSKDSTANSRNFPGAPSGFKAFHQRLARRPIPSCKEAEFPPGFPGMQRSSSEVTLSECDPEEIPEFR